MNKVRQLFLLFVFGSIFAGALILKADEEAKKEAPKIYQCEVVLTVSESKRLIAQAVAQMPIVKEAMKNGMVIITKGTTNTYIAEELLGKKVEHGSFVIGRTYPAKGGKKLENKTTMAEIVLLKGNLKEGMSLDEAVKQLRPGDVVIKGANALDYQNRMAGIIVGAGDGGTTGKIVPSVIAKKAHLVIPVGLEKQVSGNVIDISNKMREPVESINKTYSLFPITGHIVTELEAFKILADVTAFQAAGGGIGGAEGSVRIVCRGEKNRVEEALKRAEKVHGEPPFVE